MELPLDIFPAVFISSQKYYEVVRFGLLSAFEIVSFKFLLPGMKWSISRNNSHSAIQELLSASWGLHWEFPLLCAVMQWALDNAEPHMPWAHLRGSVDGCAQALLPLEQAEASLLPSISFQPGAMAFSYH